MSALTWLILAAILAVAEIFAPGAVLIWFALAAAIVSLLVYAIPETLLLVQVIVFLGVSILDLILWKLFVRKHAKEDPANAINHRLESLVGRVGRLSTAIVHGQGRVHLGDTTWTVSGPDQEEGAAVRITGIQNGGLICEPASDKKQ